MKTITVPKNIVALKKLDLDACPADELIELNLNSEVTDQLFQIGFFRSINIIANCMIDDYEDEQITDPILLGEILESGTLQADEYPRNIQSVINQIKQLFVEAISRKTGVFFYF